MPGLHHIRRHAPLAAILLLGAALRLWNLAQNGFGTDYYAAGLRSMLGSPHHFFYLSFDPAGFVSLDKPPLAFWLQGLSALIFGYSGPSLLLPQVVEGLCAIALLYHLVMRRFGRGAGLAAALGLTLMPVSVAVDRSGNTDSALVLLLLLAAWALLRAIETRRLSWLLATAALGGLAFNTKMLAAFVLLPGFIGLWWFGTALAWRDKLRQLAMSSALLIAVSLSWAVVFDLTPAANRPYAGSSKTNSMLELAIGHNGLERFRRSEAQHNADPAAQQFYDAVPVGPLRLADRHLAAQVLWLLPLALSGLVMGWRTGADRRELSLWTAWLFSYGLVFSITGGIFHAYYLATLGPPLAALAGIGVTLLWQRRRALLVTLGLCAIWQAYIAGGSLSTGGADDIALWLMLLPALALPFAVAAPIRIAAGAGLLVLMLNPLAWSWSNAAARDYAMLPAADLDRLTGREDAQSKRNWRRVASAAPVPSADPKLAAFLQANRQDERYALATPTTRLAAPLIISDGLPVMAYGGFSGRDPILTLEDFAQRVRAGELRFVLISRGLPTGSAPVVLNDDDPRRQFARWVLQTGKPVPASYWRSNPGGDERAWLVDLRPDLGQPRLVSGAAR